MFTCEGISNLLRPLTSLERIKLRKLHAQIMIMFGMYHHKGLYTQKTNQFFSLSDDTQLRHCI